MCEKRDLVERRKQGLRAEKHAGWAADAIVTWSALTMGAVAKR